MQWNIEGLEDGESVESVAPILGGAENFTLRLVLTDRRIVTIRSPYFASTFGLARYAKSRIQSSLPLDDVESTVFTSSTGGFLGKLEIQSPDGTATFSATGIGSRWLRRLSMKLPNKGERP